MRFICRAAFASLVLSAAAFPAFADNDWKTVTLENNPDFTIELPAVVADDYKPSAKDAADGDLFFVAIKTGDNSYMDCGGYRFKYTKTFTRDVLAARIATSEDARASFCNPSKGVKNATLLDSAVVTTNGLSASTCAASYTDPKKSSPGQVLTWMEIPARKSTISISCTIESDDQDDAEFDWEDFWKDQIDHMQTSLHIPDTEK